MPVEAQFTEWTKQHPRTEAVSVERREHRLVKEYESHLRRNRDEVGALELPVDSTTLRTDLVNVTRGHLIEAKGTTRRESVRMAIGELADYAYLIEEDPPGSLPHPLRNAILVPSRLSQALERLLSRLDIAVVWKTGDGFTDNADGAFV